MNAKNTAVITLGSLSLLFGTALSSSSSAFASDTASFRGTGIVKHEVEQIAVVVNVHSKCYKSPVAAYEAADRTISQVMSLLGAHLVPGNEKDKVVYEGATTSEYSIDRYVNNTTEHLCVGTYQAEGSVILKTSKIKDFGKTFAQIQQSVLSVAQPSLDESKESVSVTVDSPRKMLYPETREKLKFQAAELAKKDAVAKFKRLCPGVRYEIASISDPEALPVTMRSRGGHGGGGPAMPVEELPIISFEPLQVGYTVDVTFRYLGVCPGLMF